METGSIGMLGLLGIALATACAADELEAPPAPFETRPRPFDGETVGANPPAFLWIPAEPTAQHVVEYSRDPTFAPEATHSVSSPWLIHVPQAPLQPGKWYWRWRPAEAGGEPSPSSSARAFTVPDDVPVVPFPDVATAVSRLGTRRPRVLVSADRLPAVRRWAAETQADLLASIRADAERALTNELLPEPEFLPAAGDPNRGPFYQKTFRTTRPVFARMARLAEGYLLSGDETMGQAARRLLMNFVSWDPDGSTSVGHNDEPATEFVRICPRVYDWIYSVLTEEERAKCRSVFETRMTQLYARWEKRPFERFPYESHNMGYYLPDLTEACIAMAGELPVEEMLRHCLLQLWSPYYPPYGGDDGGWQEGPGYWQWTMAVVARLYYLVEQATGARISQRTSVRYAAAFKLYANPPYAKMQPFGDGQAGAAGGGHTMYRLAVLYQDPYALWYARQKNVSPAGLEALIWDVSGLEPRPPIDLPQGCCFSSVGEACLHTALWSATDNVQLLVRSCPFGGISHAYADQNTFALDAYGEPLIVASGYYPYYGSPHHVQWTRTTAASNSVLVNNQGQARNWDARGDISAFVGTPGADYVVGDATKAYPGLLKQYFREVLFVRPLQTGGPALIAIHDELEAEEPSTFQWLLHALQEMQVDGGAQTVHIQRGDARCQVQFLMPIALELTQTDQFTVPPETGDANQWHLTASTADKAAAQQSLIVLVPHRADEESSLPEIRLLGGSNCVATVATRGTAEHVLLFRTGADAAVVPELGLETDGQAMALSRRNGNVSGFFAVNATRLTLGGRALLESTAEADIGVLGFDGDSLVSARSIDGATCHVACSREPAEVEWVHGQPAGTAYDPDARRLAIHATREPSVARLTFGGEATWPQSDAPEFALGDTPLADVTATVFPLIRRVRYGAQHSSGGGHHELVVRAHALSERSTSLTVAAGADEWRLPPTAGGGWQDLRTPPIPLPASGGIALTVDGSLGGACEVQSVRARRVYGRNLVPNPSFTETEADGSPRLWTPGTITNGALCAIETASPGRTDADCLKITCTRAGGEFGANLHWVGVAPAAYDRQFRLGVWVRNGADSEVGVQVTDRTWKFHQTTERISGCEEWTESASTFTLPTGEDLTHLRLHMRAATEDVIMYADDVTLVELPPE